MSRWSVTEYDDGWCRVLFADRLGKRDFGLFRTRALADAFVAEDGMRESGVEVDERLERRRRAGHQ